MLEVGIAFFRQQRDHVAGERAPHRQRRRVHPARAGTEHGDWWSLHGAWIFAGTAAVSLLSKHVIRLHGRHIFNPSNFGLVLCFLVLGKARAEPLDFWWGPMSPWLALAVGLIVVGGFTILTRLRLLAIAVGFWLTFAAGIGSARGERTLDDRALARRADLGLGFWWLLVTSPEILIFLFFMITDPKTIPTDAPLASYTPSESGCWRRS